ncbi:MAG: DMT family transporter [Solirubrobacterales bacterium]
MKKGYIYSISSAILFGTAGLFVKMAHSTGLDSISLLTVQYMFAVTMMFAGALIKNPSLMKVNKSDLFHLAVLGVVGNTFMTIFYYIAFEYLPVAMVTMLLYTYPVMVMIYTWIFEKQILNIRKFIAIIIAFIGCLLALDIIGGNFIYSLTGIIFGLLSAVFYSFMNIYSEKRLMNVGSFAINAYSTLFSLIALIFYRLPDIITTRSISSNSLMYIVILAVFCEILPLTLLYAAIKHIGSLKVSLIGNLEIPTAIFSAFIFLNEKISMVQLAGSVMIIYSVFLIRQKNQVPK